LVPGASSAAASSGVINSSRNVAGPVTDPIIEAVTERLDDGRLFERLLDSMRHFYGVLAGAAEGSHAVGAEGVHACVVPAAPQRSYPNAVMYEDASALVAAYERIRAAYARAGVAAWTVWVPEDDSEAAAFLEGRGHRLDATPAAMARELPGVERPAPGTLDEWTRQGDTTVVGDLNNRAYGFDDVSLARVFSRFGGPGVNVYVGRAGGEPVTCLVTTDKDGNCEIDAVATPPEARGRGLSGQLLAHALADAGERGCETTTLVATALGRPVYDRLGYRVLGALQMWELRR
jgi:GNAT superfamily N-acetyltransferase